jgi:exodeoxyribonuclease-3
MKIVSWNVAGFRAVLKKGFEEFFDSINADVFCIQESKVELDQFNFNKEGYDMYLYPAEKKGYSGTLIYSKVKPLSISYGMGIEEHDHEGRIITLEFNDFYLVNEYVPNVKRDLSRLDYRMTWEDDFRNYLKSLEKTKPVVVCGDFNVAHNEIDIKNAKANIGNAGFTYEERGKFSELLDAGFTDTFRYLHPDEVKYSWWSYIGHARDRNIGWRIDYFVTSKSIINKVKGAYIFDNVMGSDHAPIGLDIDLK